MTTSVPVVTPQPYNIRKSLEGDLLGLDNSSNATALSGEAVAALGDYAPYLTGRDWQGLRIFPAGQFSKQGSDYKIGAVFKHVEFMDDFNKTSVDAFWHQLSGSDGSCQVALQQTLDNGIIRLTSGNGSTHTQAVNGAQLVGNVQHNPTDGGLRIEERIGSLSSALSQSIFFGFCDSSSLSAPFTLTGTTVTANATNGAGFLQDANGTNTALNAVSVNAGGTPQVIALSQTISTTANTYDTYRVEIDNAGNAVFFIDGTDVGSISGAVSAGALLAPTVGMFSEANSASANMQMDYAYFQKVRTGF